MKLVILDADPALGSARALRKAAQPGQGPEKSVAPGAADEPISTDSLSALGELIVYQHTAPDEVVTRAKGVPVLMTNKVVLGEAEFSRLPELRLVSVLATGVNVVDLDAARRRHITVCNVPGYSTMSTAQHCFALLLELTNQVGSHAAHVADGGWSKSRAFSYFLEPIVELCGLTLGIIGYGAIGRQMATLGQAFGMRVLVHSRTNRADDRVAFVDRDTLLAESDVVSLHCALTDETRHLINAVTLAQMKPSAYLLNCARGPIVDDHALADALHRGVLRGAAVDVLSVEPPPLDHPLLGAPRLLITPHIAWASSAARTRLITLTAQNIRAFLAATPQNVVT